MVNIANTKIDIRGKLPRSQEHGGSKAAFGSAFARGFESNANAESPKLLEKMQLCLVKKFYKWTLS